MKMTNNTILITGGGSGIGQALAEMFHARGNQVIITGRDQTKLDSVVSQNHGMIAMMLDVTDALAIKNFAATIQQQHPTLNVVIHNAGMMAHEQIGVDDLTIAEAEIATNLLGPIRLNSALLPTLQAQPAATVITVTSGLAFVPIFPNPTYCATKAALHSYTESLRYQLRDSTVQVIELIPPYVQTQLTGAHQATDENAMPLTDFIAEVASILETTPNVNEVCVKRVMLQRNAASRGDYDKTYAMINDSVAKARAQ